MKKIAIFLAFFTILTYDTFAAPADTPVASTNYVKEGLNTKQNTLVSTDTVAIGSDNKITVRDGTQTEKGLVTYGTIPTSSAGTGSALIWVE